MPTFFQRLFTRPTATKVTTPDPRHTQVVARTADMVRAKDARALAKKHGLDILDLTWEDTGRFKGSCVGPNISDMTIQVSAGDRITCMPVIRYPNFSDKTADVSIDDVVLRVGNQTGAPLASVTLREYLRDLRKFLTKPGSWAGSETSLLAPREKDVLVSAQACFLPVPPTGKAEFNPVLFNYQSYAKAPAVLAIVATREGTSATIIDNQRDGFGAGHAWGQRLFHNATGERASFTGTRMTEFVAAGGDATDKVDTMEAAKAAGLSCVMLIQVPLQQPQVQRRSLPMMMSAPPAAAKCAAASFDEEACLDEAVIGHGEVEGPFTEIDNLAIKRDPRFPIRVTVQFYKATANGVVTAADMQVIADQITAVYKDAKAVGSLVCDPDKGRSTEWDDNGLGKTEPKDWWETFWKTQESATGKSRTDLMRQLEQLLGRRPTESELEAAIKKVFTH
ncbi:MAG: hypothetical protein H0T46_20575 [Deltaproteobacteria bacterium]|nr:hypothetical protein [Deltaproteobacteria bacterium]